MLSLLVTHSLLLVLLTLTLGQELVRRIADGDASALRRAYDAHAGRVLALALRIVRSRAEAEDVVQDTFVEVWRRAGDYDPQRGEVSAWIMGMARSRCIDRVRRARVRSAYAMRTKSDDNLAHDAPDENAVTNEHGAHVRKVLALLPTEQRTALELAYFDGLTQQQIASQVGAPLGTVKTRIRLALEKLSKELEALR